MAIKDRNGNVTFEGAVLNLQEHMWMDGMLEVNAVCWNSETRQIEYHQVGYYGIDGQNLQGCTAEIDATPETWRQVLNHIKPDAYRAFADSVTAHKQEIRKGTHAKVVRGKKVQKGTEVEVFWIGERPTYRSRRYDWMNETETVAGCYDQDGNKLWIKAEYLQNVDPIQSPNAKERRKFIKAYVEKKARELGAPWKIA